MTDMYHTQQVKTITISAASTDDTQMGTVTIVLHGYPVEKLLINEVEASRMTKEQVLALLKVEWSKLTDPYTEESILAALHAALAEQASDEVSRTLFEMLKSAQTDNTLTTAKVNQSVAVGDDIEPEHYFRALADIKAHCDAQKQSDGLVFITLPKLLLAVNHAQEDSPTHIVKLLTQLIPNDIPTEPIPLTEMVKFLITHNLI